LKTLAEFHSAANAMDGSLGWQRAIEDLGGDDQAARAELKEIMRWFPSLQMMQNHARGLIKVMMEDEKLHSMPSSPHGVPGISPTKILQFTMREMRSDDPRQRTRWWMYWSTTAPPSQPDPTRVVSRTERVDDVILALPAPINTAYWDWFQPDLLLPDDVSDADSSSDSEYAQLDSDADSGYEPESESSDEEEVEVVVLSDDEPDDVQMVAPAVDANEGGKNLPIDVEALPDVPDVPHIIVVKQEDQEEVRAHEEGEGQKKKRAAAKKRHVAGEVRRSERMKLLKSN
jgi:hypothetical protein